MKKRLLFCISPVLFFCSYAVKAQDIHVVNVPQQCAGLSNDQKVRLSVSSFDVSTINNPGNFGDELAQMLTNALQNTGCFDVLLGLKDMKAVNDNMVVNKTGAVGNPIESGQFKSAQVLVVGKVIEYRNPEDPEYIPTGATGVSIADNAHIGFILQLINPVTNEIIASTQFSVDGPKIVNWKAKLPRIHFGHKTIDANAHGKSNGGKSFMEAEDKAIIAAVEYITAHKNQMPLPMPDGGIAETKTYNSTNCAVLNSAYVPRIMVILPEYHLTVRIPDPAGETEINRKLVDAGFKVVDPALYAAVEKTMEFDEAAKDPMKAISLGKRFGADIVIYGQAFSEIAGTLGSQVSCRARVEARAVRTDDATIIATNGFEAGAVDIAEHIAGKEALQKAGAMVADYMLSQFCTRNLTFSKSSEGSTGLNDVDITILNTDYSGLRSLAGVLSFKGTILQKSINNGTGDILLQCKGSLDDITDYIDSKLKSKFTIKDVGDGKITLVDSSRKL